MDPVIIDDIVTEDIQDRLFQVMVGQKIKWQYLGATSNGPCLWYRDNDENCSDAGQFVSTIYDDMDDRIGVPYTDFFLAPLIQAEPLLDVKVNSIYRIKANMLWKANEGLYNIPHMDWHKEPEQDFLGGPLSKNIHYLTAVYYLHDGDGDTIMFKNEYTKSHSPRTSDDIDKELVIEERVSPKKGRLLVFDSNRYHASSNPKETEYRFILNYVFEISK